MPAMGVTLDIYHSARVDFIMTTSQAAALRVKWQQRDNPPACEHLNLELEWTDTGFLTGNYNCIVCGKTACHKQT